MDRGLLCDLKETAWSAEVPPAAVYIRPHQEGSVIQGKVWESHLSVEVDHPESLLKVATGDCLFLMVRASLCVVGAQERGVLTLKHETACFQLSR